MRKSRFTDEQILAILQEAERTERSGDEIRRHGNLARDVLPVAPEEGGLQVRDTEPLRVLEDESRRLSVPSLLKRSISRS